MNRRTVFAFLAATLVATGIGAAPVAAQTIVDRVVADLKRQGYNRIRIRRTLLGRVQIAANGPGKEREIVVNPNTGEILRDILDDESDDLWGGEDSDDRTRSGSSGGSENGGDDHSDSSSEDDDSSDDSHDDSSDDSESEDSDDGDDDHDDDD